MQLRKEGEESSRLAAANKQLERSLEEARKASLTASVCPATPPHNGGSGGTPSPAGSLARLPLRAKLSSSMHEHIRGGSVSVDSADKGDRVMVVWSEEHNNFAVYLEPSSGAALHFLHSDSLEPLGLAAGGGARRYVTAEVLDKEYCQAKKSENRFRVPQGTRFYRVKCKPAATSGGGAADREKK